MSLLVWSPVRCCPAGPHCAPHPPTPLPLSPRAWAPLVPLPLSFPPWSLQSPPDTSLAPLLSHRPVLPPSGCRASPSLALAWPWEVRACCAWHHGLRGPPTLSESAWGAGRHVEVLLLTPPQHNARRPFSGETRRQMPLPSLTASGLPSGTSTGPRSVGGGKGMWSCPPSPRPSMPHEGTASVFWRRATLASWATPPPPQRPPHSQLTVPPSRQAPGKG